MLASLGCSYHNLFHPVTSYTVIACLFICLVPLACLLLTLSLRALRAASCHGRKYLERLQAEACGSSLSKLVSLWTMQMLS